MQSLLVGASFFAIAACELEGREDGGGPAPERCSSGEASFADEGPLMEPGGDCIGCHASSGEGPDYAIAGTVMGAVDDDDRCSGTDGVTVEITDAEKTIILETNAVGNFYYRGPLTPPYTAKVIRGGAEIAMSTPQSTGNCATCHSSEGSSGAPGRIIAP